VTASNVQPPPAEEFRAEFISRFRMAAARQAKVFDPFERREIKKLVAEFGSPLLIVDCERIRRQYRQLRRALPRVDLHYALKPLPHPAVVSTIVEEGGFLDLATTGEVELVARLGVDGERCIHTHPIKRDADIRAAVARRVRVFVADNPDELRSSCRTAIASKCCCASRIAVPVPSPIYRASSVVTPNNCYHSHAAPTISASPCAVCRSTSARKRRIPASTSRRSNRVAGYWPPRRAKNSVPATRWISAEAFHRLFAARAGDRLLLRADPRRARRVTETRACDCRARSLHRRARRPIGVASVMGRARRENRWWYYLDDGLYGSFSGQLFDHAHYPLESLRDRGKREPSVLAGPTCDSIDVIAENLTLPQLEVGDLIVGRAMGATLGRVPRSSIFFRARRSSPSIKTG
jgi:ornithine decarboxylase